jgi:hypothetical protein
MIQKYSQPINKAVISVKLITAGDYYLIGAK